MDCKYNTYSEATKKKLVDLILMYQALWDEENKELQKKPAEYKYNKTLKAWKYIQSSDLKNSDLSQGLSFLNGSLLHFL